MDQLLQQGVGYSKLQELQLQLWRRWIKLLPMEELQQNWRSKMEKLQVERMAQGQAADVGCSKAAARQQEELQKTE